MVEKSKNIMNYTEDITKKLKFFAEGESKVLERYRNKTFGFLDYKENIVVPKIIDYLGLSLFRDKKTLRISSDAGLIEYEIFNLLLGKTYYDGKLWGIEIEDLNILGGELIVAELYNIQFNGIHKPVVLSQNFFNDVLFSKCRFTSVDFTNSIFKNCKFIDCYFIDCDFQNCIFGTTAEELHSNATMRFRPNVVKDCVNKNCSFSTSQGTGSAPFFSDSLNERLTEAKNYIWEGEKEYNKHEEVDLLPEIEKD